MKSTFFLCVAVASVAGTSCVSAPRPGVVRDTLVAAVEPNDNRVAAGSLRDGVLRLDLDVVWAGWRPDDDVDTLVTVQAFAERGKSPMIPGPFVRVPEGTEIRATVRNTIPDSTLVVHGFRPGWGGPDTFSVAPGAVREIVFTAGGAGTFLYWATTSGSTFSPRMGRDALLSGAIVVDPAGSAVDPRERIFVVSLIDHFSDSSAPPPHEEIWEAAINGKSWPHTERLSYPMGDTARWRFINASDRPHPMHLHGFHFLVTAKGNGRSDTSYTADKRRYAVTELMLPGSTFALEWHLTRPGNWLAHCHMIPHIVPFPERADSSRMHDLHAVARHPELSMAGLVLGVTVTDPNKAHVVPDAPAVASHRLYVQQGPTVAGRRSRKGYVLQRGAHPPAPDSVEIPGTPLIVTRGERTSVTIVNRLAKPTSVHWHGMELESVFDGVAGYSGTGSNIAPLIAPGDSFTVWFTPPRAGTYMYHTHMDEEDQLITGMYAPLLVMEPGERHDPETDRTMIIGSIPNDRGGIYAALNGARQPEPMIVEPGRTYRLRFANMLYAPRVNVELRSDTALHEWRPVSKDGAILPVALTGSRPARANIGVGETYDFEWTAPAREALLTIQPIVPPQAPQPPPLLQRVVTRP